jgi:hypothetical protein
MAIKQSQKGYDTGTTSPSWSADPPGIGKSASVDSTPATNDDDAIGGLPAEFALYLAATRRWQSPALADKSAARQSWESILELPVQNRHFKSTWAAYMLGRSWETDNPARAAEYYQRAREFAQSGFSDGLGLAEESLGREGHVAFTHKRYALALELYMKQLAAGDSSAGLSVCFVLRDVVVHGTGQFPRLIQNPLTRRLVTAYLISTTALRRCWVYPIRIEGDSVTSGAAAEVSDWLRLAEKVGVNDPESIEELALVAYQNEDWNTAQRWISRAGNSPVAQWVEAKLLLRDGKLDEGGARLQHVASLFPLGPRDTNAASALKSDLSTHFVACRYDGSDAARQIRGELGIYQLARGNYPAALKFFLEADSWIDAAYIAERVMTTDELKAFVDANPVETASFGSASDISTRLRYLLARRLTRELRGNEAREYYPSAWQPEFDSLAEALLSGWDDNLPAEERARALFDAAKITRTNGMELLGTELGPDWKIYDGAYEGSLLQTRRTNQFDGLFPASADELARADSHGPDPAVRFHYRYQAAALAWEAARLMPNDSPETARVLWLAGTWLKNRDPDTADLFYKALVRRNRNTPLGSAADQLRWFPSSDEVDDLTVTAPDSDAPDPTAVPDQNDATEVPAEDEMSNEYPMPGKVYIVHPGDSLATIVEAANIWGEPISREDLLEANPGLEEGLLKVGMGLNIPAAGQEPH